MAEVREVVGLESSLSLSLRLSLSSSRGSHGSTKVAFQARARLRLFIVRIQARLQNPRTACAATRTHQRVLIVSTL